MPRAQHNLSSGQERRFAELVSDAFSRSGWIVVEEPSGGVDLLLKKKGKVYAAKVKRSTEARKDRAVPLLAQAILQVQAAARSAKPAAAPLAIVAAQRIPEGLAEELHDFAAHYAPDVAVGVVDLEGFRSFRGPGLEELNAPRSAKVRDVAPHTVSSPQLFSDLNQWMLKVLLGPRIPESYLNAPRQDFKNASQLAEAADVTVMSASRLVRSLKHQGFIDESSGVLEVVRIPELLRRWQASDVRPTREIPVRWIINRGGDQLAKALRPYGGQLEPETKSSSRSRMPLGAPRASLGLFAAADALGAGFVRGVPPTIYLERPDASAIEKLGLSAELSGEPPDVFIRIPRSPEAVFRAVVIRDSVPVSDALQVWLDVSNHPARGKEQAEQLRKGVLAGLFEEDY